MPFRTGIVILSLGCALASPVVFAQQAALAKTAPSASAIAPEIRDHAFATLAGKPVKLSDFHGKKVYLKFWATWCPLCLAGLEDLTALARQFSGARDVAILSVVAPGVDNEVGRADFVAWAKGQGIAFPVLLDDAGVLKRAFAIRGYPAAIYIDADGRLVKTTHGDALNAQILRQLAAIAPATGAKP